MPFASKLNQNFLSVHNY